MQTQLETLERLERRLTMAVPTQDIEKEVEDRLKKLSRTVRMHGFRPGKVPMRIVAQQYGPQVRSEVVGDAVQKAFDAAVQENKLRVAGNPRIESKEGDASQMAFSATFEVYPEVALGDVAKTKVEKLAHTVTDEDVDQTIEILRKQRGSFEPAERAAAEGDRVTMDYTGTIDGTEFAGGKGTDFQLVLGEKRMIPGFEEQLAGVKAGETKGFDIKFPDDYHGKEVAGKNAHFEVTVKKVEAPKLPELNGDFARSLGVADGDVAKMRDEVKANVEREVKKRIDADLRNKVMQALIDSTPVELPNSLVQMESNRMVQSARQDLESRGIKMEQMPINPQVFEDQAKRRVALGLILGELVKAHALNAAPEQIRTLIEDYAQSYEQPNEMVRWLYSDQRRLAEFEGLAVEGNVVKWVLEHAAVEEKQVSFDELMNRNA